MKAVSGRLAMGPEARCLQESAGRCNLVSGVKEVPMAEPARWINERDELPVLSLPEREDGKPWPAQGDWTYEDYLLLPDDGQHYEVLYGALSVTPAPRYEHQEALSELHGELRNHVRLNKLGRVLVAPFDINLPRGIASPVEPDIIFLRTGNTPRRGERSFTGVPDLVAEVHSPGTRHRDRTTKFKAYQEAGVPEYWMVDPDDRTVEVYILRDGRYLQLCRGGVGDVVRSEVVEGFRLAVAELFPEE
jgi:Uma2 family endonuclease